MRAILGEDTRVRLLRFAGRLLSLRDPLAVRERDGRVAGAVCLVAAGYSALVTPALGGPDGRSAQIAVAALWAVGAALCFVTPWRALPGWAVQVPAAYGVVLLSVGDGALAGVLGGYAACYALLFGFVGLTGGPRDALRLTGLAWAGLLVAGTVGQQRTDRVALAVTIALAAAAGQIVTLAMWWNRTSGDRVGLLRRALADLTGAGSEVEASELAATAAVKLLDADSAAMVLTEHPGATVLTCRGGAWLDPAAAAVRIDLPHEQSGVSVVTRSGLPLFVADVATSPVVSRRLATEFGMGSALFLPVPGEGGVMGALVIGWREPRSAPDPFGRQLAEMLTAPAGQVVQRLRRAGQLDTVSMKDQLKGVGNRRRFEASLSALPVGGVVLVFNLDSFKSVNTLYGLDVGDDTLRMFAATLRRCVRDDDVVARLGGDEFGILLTSATSAIAGGIIIERLQRIWQAPNGCRFSVGVAVRTADEVPSDTLSRAGQDLQATKRLKSH